MGLLRFRSTWGTGATRAVKWPPSAVFAQINLRVLANNAILSNVEADFDSPAADAGCGFHETLHHRIAQLPMPSSPPLATGAKRLHRTLAAVRLRLVHGRDVASAWVGGLLGPRLRRWQSGGSKATVHFMIGIVFYGLAIALLGARLPGASHVGHGVLIDAIGWLVMLVMMMPMAGMGLFGMQLCVMAPVMTLVLHLIFGAVLGWGGSTANPPGDGRRQPGRWVEPSRSKRSRDRPGVAIE